MLIRIVDFVANRGGGLRFAAELTVALVRRQPKTTFELVSHAAGVAAYRATIGTGHSNLRYQVVAPAGRLLRRLTPLLRLPGARRLAARRGLGGLWHFEVPGKLLEGSDAVWLPWLHRHRLPWAAAGRIVASFHDATFLRFGRLAAQHPHSLFVEDERETTALWLRSSARVVCSSVATRDELSGAFGVALDRVEVVPVAGDHSCVGGRMPGLPPWPWLERPYLLYPANTALHKNHEVLFRGVGAWGTHWPLVLTGEGSDLDGPWPRQALSALAALGVIRPPRSTALRQLAESVGLVVGETLHPLGFVRDGVYRALLERAAALVMPTLAEGGGSFPVYEAARRGVPVVCSDLPVLREQVEREGMPVLFFDPHRPESLAETLAHLADDYAGAKARATEYARCPGRRRWDDVAGEYWQRISAVAGVERG